jgi:hypothetical protein
MSSLDCCLDNLPLYRGSVTCVGGPMANVFAKRLRFFLRRLKPRSRVVISTAERMSDPRVINIYIPSYSSEVNSFLDRAGVTGVIRAHDGEHGTFVDAVTGVVTPLTLPPMPKAASDLIEQLGY